MVGCDCGFGVRYYDRCGSKRCNYCCVGCNEVIWIYCKLIGLVLEFLLK